MLRRVAIFTLLAGVFASSAHAATPVRGQTLMPGVVYSKQVEFTTHGPVVVHVISAPKPTGGLYQLKPVLSNNAIQGRERVTSMQRSVSGFATVAGVNGDLFNWKDGHPTGALLRDGVLDSPPSDSRSSVGVGADGVLHVDRIQMAGTWKGSGQRRLLGLNEPATRRRSTLYTTAWGPTTPAENNVVAVVLQPFPGSRPNLNLAAPVVQVVQSGSVPIPAGGAVLVARNDAQFLAAEAPVGTQLSIRLTLTPSWAGIADGLGGGPVIVRNGKPVFRSFELFTTAQLSSRDPRTGVGQTADGRILLVAVDGRRPGYSMGLTNFELALLLTRLGAVTASALDAGGSTTMAFDGRLLNRPSDPGGERAVAESLNILYFGAYAPALTYPVLSPNGDGFAETQAFAYKIVRPSTVNVTLSGPGASVPLDAGSRAPGTYRFSWPGSAPAPEGRWTFSATADDDQGRHSVSERQFSVNSTLGFVEARAAGRRLTATFRLARPARVVTRIETPAGVILRTLPGRSLDTGPATVSWRGRPGNYVLSVTATNEVGSVEQTAPFRLRR